MTPFIHSEVPDSLFVSPGPGKGIRQAMGWKRVRGTAQSKIWVLKGNARARMLPTNLDLLRVEWRKRGSYESAWLTPGPDCLCSYANMDMEQQSEHKLNDSSWDGVNSLWSRVAHLLSPWCARGNVPTGVNLEPVLWLQDSCIPWHSDNEPLFGPQNQPKLIVSMSLGHSVEFKVRRRAPGDVPSSIQVDHGDLLVMDGLAQLEYAHRTVSGLQGPRVNLTYSWVSTARCVLSTRRRGGLCSPLVCARFSQSGFPCRGFWRTKLDCVLVDDSPSVNRVVCPSGACPD